MEVYKIKYLEPITVAISSVVAVRLIAPLKEIISVDIVVLATSAVMSILTYNTIIFLINTLPKKNHWTRKIIDPRAKYEGFYLEIKYVENVRSYAIVCLIYHYDSDEYQVSGTALDCNGKIGLQWKSNFVRIDPNQKKVIYSQSGQLTDTAEGKLFDGVTYMNYEYFNSKTPTSGVGHYIDTLPAKSDFYFQKISEDDCMQYIGKKKIENREDYKSFINQFHLANMENLFIWESKY